MAHEGGNACRSLQAQADRARIQGLTSLLLNSRPANPSDSDMLDVHQHLLLISRALIRYGSSLIRIAQFHWIPCFTHRWTSLASPSCDSSVHRRAAFSIALPLCKCQYHTTWLVESARFPISLCARTIVRQGCLWCDIPDWSCKEGDNLASMTYRTACVRGFASQLSHLKMVLSFVFYPQLVGCEAPRCSQRRLSG